MPRRANRTEGRHAHAIPPVIRHNDRACLGEDPTVFYPTTGPATEAREICGRCPHRAECLEWALDTGQMYGFWGGASADEREQMLADRAGEAA